MSKEVNWQAECLKKGFEYVREPDDHYVIAAPAEMVALLRDLLGVDVRTKDGDDYGIAVSDLQEQVDGLVNTLHAQQAERDALRAERDALRDALNFSCKSLCKVTSSDGSGHADIALSALRLAGVGADEREALVDGWKANVQWRTDRAPCKESSHERRKGTRRSLRAARRCQLPSLLGPCRPVGGCVMATEFQRAKRKAVYVTCSVMALIVFAVVHGLADRITNGVPV